MKNTVEDIQRTMVNNNPSIIQFVKDAVEKFYIEVVMNKVLKPLVDMIYKCVKGIFGEEIADDEFVIMTIFYFIIGIIPHIILKLIMFYIRRSMRKE